MSDLITEAAELAAKDAVREAEEPDWRGQISIALNAAAPLIVADQLERMARWLTPTPPPSGDLGEHGYHDGRTSAVRTLKRRAAELRGETDA